MRQNAFAAGALDPDPAGGAYSALPDPLACGVRELEGNGNG